MMNKEEIVIFRNKWLSENKSRGVKFCETGVVYTENFTHKTIANEDSELECIECIQSNK